MGQLLTGHQLWARLKLAYNRRTTGVELLVSVGNALKKRRIGKLADIRHKISAELGTPDKEE
jgi:hypothetical protein